MEQVVYYHKRDKAYPERMRPYPDMPAGIYTKGRLPFEGVPSAAIVGARACSVYGRVQAKRYARELAAAGGQIISGLAPRLTRRHMKERWKAEASPLRYLAAGWISVTRKRITL